MSPQIVTGLLTGCSKQSRLSNIQRNSRPDVAHIPHYRRETQVLNCNAVLRMENQGGI
uniref:Serine/threonine-protein phosphatase PP2A catalytic subunit-like n=1 Tax=Rhizophora mucronata TaxID=61149 RepID=A0A2P2MMN8_RHIMU